MVVFHVEDGNVDSSTASDGHCIHLMGYWDFQYVHIVLTLIFFFGSVFLGCLL